MTLRTPTEWLAWTGGQILDPDGWRDGGRNEHGERQSRAWDEPISAAEFDARYAQSTALINARTAVSLDVSSLTRLR